ncbi:MAG: fatty acid--CoA ligase family protein [Rhodospirillaceae bacterium]|nr:fatty acid--CoA ligase family protein [Rhodospirillaceae bacterium]
MDFCDRIQATLDARPQGRALEYGGRWYTWSDVKRVGAEINTVMAAAKVPEGARVGVVVRNRAIHASVLLNLLAKRISISLIYAFQSPELLAAEIRKLALPVIAADVEDWPMIDAAAREAGSAGIALDGMDKPLSLRPGLERAIAVSKPLDEPGVEVLSSGTTGAPKRLPMPFRMLNRAVMSAPSAFAGEELPVQINIWPFGGVGGICLLTGSGVTGAPLSIIEKFSAEEFAASARRNNPQILGLSPTAVRMIYDADIPKETFASVKGVFGGSARLDPDLQEKFEKKYGILIHWGMGATEFCGTVVSWTPALRQQYGDSKRGSVGKPMPGIELRVAHPETGEILGPNQEGLLEVLCPEIRPDWVRTTDLVTIDADGFVFHIARYDGAIVRGGFKILPERVAEVIRSHPSVADAAVVGLDDDRLGAVPVAAVELRPGAPAVTAEELDTLIRKSLPSPQVPTKILIVPALPRTPSLKVSLGDVKKLFAA